MRPKSQSPSPWSPDGHVAGIGIWLVAVLLVPRIVRLYYPEVWVEDDFYLESAWFVSVGMRPYLDFVHPHMPLLEWIVAGYLRLFGASHFSIEVLNEGAIYLTSLLVFSLASRITDRRTAILSSILYAFSSLVFRYHVYERECFVTPLVLMAVIGAIRSDLDTRGQAIRQTAYLVTACAIKLTALIPCAVVLIFLGPVRRRWRAAIGAAIGIGAGLLAFGGLLYWLYGREFIFQTLVFHLMKGHQPLATIAAYPGQILDILAPLFVLGVVGIIIERKFSRGIGLVIAMAAAEYAFFGILSPTAWGHNYLEALPYIAIVAGVGLDRIVGALIAVFDRSRGPQGRDLAWAVAGPIAIIVALTTVTPLVNENWLRGSVYGFGFVPRSEIARLGRAINQASGPEDEVIAPAFVCFEANRRELIRYPETYGVYREAQARVRRDGLPKARATMAPVGFFTLIARTAGYWMAPIREAVATGKVSVFVADSRIQMLPLVGLSPEFLVRSGFRPLLSTEHFTLWKRPRPEGSAH